MQVEARYFPPHRREGSTLENVIGESLNVARAINPQRIFTQTNPLTQPRAYEGGFSFNGDPEGIMQPPAEVNGNRGQQVQQVPQYPFRKLDPILDLWAIREVVQELYGSGLRQIGCLDFYKPYPKIIDKENPYQRGYRISDFSLFSGEDGQSTMDHVARFTVQCRKLANYKNLYHFKLRLFRNSLTGATFTWYTTLLMNSIQSWQEMNGNSILSSSGLSLKCAL